jgi:hypothetical protein
MRWDTDTRLRQICRTLSFSELGRNKRQASALSGLKLPYEPSGRGEFRMRLFQPVMLVCAVAMSFIGALGLPGCARAIGECLNDKHGMA